MLALLLLLLVDAAVDAVDPVLVVQWSNMNPYWLGENDVRWWTTNGRYLEIEAWVEARYGMPCWKWDYNRRTMSLEQCIAGVLNHMREDRVKMIEGNRCELKRAGILGESD